MDVVNETIDSNGQTDKKDGTNLWKNLTQIALMKMEYLVHN